MIWGVGVEVEETSQGSRPAWREGFFLLFRSSSRGGYRVQVPFFDLLEASGRGVVQRCEVIDRNLDAGLSTPWAKVIFSSFFCKQSAGGRI